MEGVEQNFEESYFDLKISPGPLDDNILPSVPCSSTFD